MIAAAIAACGVGAGESEEGTANLTVTRDHGAERLLEADVSDPTASETVVRFLDREAEIETSYGGNFVDSIAGIDGAIAAGRSQDWFFYVNGYWSPVGAGEARVRAGDRIWWDYRDWTDAYRVPAVVGSFPEPFLDGFEGERFPTEVICFGADPPCERVSERLSEVGVDAPVVAAGESGSDPKRTLRVLVGSWDRLRDDPAAALLSKGPAESGVYAVPARCGDGWGLSVRDERARETALLADAGWVAAVRVGEEQPSWIVSASDDAELAEAVEVGALEDQVRLVAHFLEGLLEQHDVVAAAHEPQQRGRRVLDPGGEGGPVGLAADVVDGLVGQVHPHLPVALAFLVGLGRQRGQVGVDDEAGADGVGELLGEQRGGSDR